MNSLKWILGKMRWIAFKNAFQLPEINLNDVTGASKAIEPPILEKLCLPPFVGPTDHNDAIPLLTIVEQHKPQNVLELGTAHGATAANICAISNARVYTVNALAEQMEGKFTTYTLSQEEIGYIYRKYGFSDRVIQIYENTKQLDITNYVPNCSIDLVIIDACHDADFVLNDFVKVMPALSKRAIVLFHDVHPSLQGHLGDSYLACMYLRKLGFDVKHIVGTWWAIWEYRDGVQATLLSSFVNMIDNWIARKLGYSPERDVLVMRWFCNHSYAKQKKNDALEPFFNEISGIFHVGANTGQERHLYAKHNLYVIWIEPIPEVFADLKLNLMTFSKQRAYQSLFTDKDNEKHEFHVANNQGASSSILPLKLHMDIWPSVAYERTITITSRTLQTFVKEEGIDITNYNVLVVDTQGTELMVLKGAASLLDNFKFVKVEAADFEAYDGCCLITEIDDFLLAHGFQEVARKKFASHKDGGNYYEVLYRRK